MSSSNAGLDTSYRAAMEFQRASADELIDKLAEVIDGLGQLKREGDERHKAMMQTLTALRGDTPDTGEVARAMETALARIDRLASRTAGAALRWVWVKALCVTGALWVVACGVALSLGYSPW